MKIAIIYGGKSSEHDASLSSFAHVLSQLDPEAVQVRMAIYIDRGGVFHLDGAPVRRSEPDLLALPKVSACVVAEILQHRWTLNLLHGQDGEDGVMAGYARIHRLRGSWGSTLGGALGMAKWAGSPVADGAMGEEGQIPQTRVIRESDLHGGCPVVDIRGPLVLKPGSSGASIKTFVVDAWSPGCLPLLRDILETSPTALVQERIIGDEYSVGVVERVAGLTALPVVRITTPNLDVYDHAAKHQAGHAFKTFADSHVTRRLQALALRLFTGLDGFGMTRTDFIVDGQGVAFFLETNTLPGLMSASIFPAMLARAGMSITDLVVELEAADRRRRAAELDVEYRYTIEEAH